MILADMLNVDRDAVVCDLAETYHIFDYKSYPPTTVATFCVGLRNDSRILMKMNGLKYPINTLLMAGVLDKLTNLVWMQSDDGLNGINAPVSILSNMLGLEPSDSKDFMVFESAQDFERMRRKILGEVE